MSALTDSNGDDPDIAFVLGVARSFHRAHPDRRLAHLSDLTRSASLNVLDVSRGIEPYAAAELFMNVGKQLWQEYWGPRMLIPLVNGLQALAEANLRRAPERQYTLLSLWPLLNCRSEARAEFLRREVPAETRPELHRYFLGAYDALSERIDRGEPMGAGEVADGGA